MADISMKELLEAGVHFGHQTRRWNPKMKKYIFGSRNGIYIIDLQKTMKLFRECADYVTSIASRGKSVLFVGTKRQAQEAIERVGAYDIPYVSQRWLGGTLTNFHTIKKSIDKLKQMEELLESEEAEDLTKRERFALERKRNKLLKLFKGIKDLNGLPDALFVIDPKREKIAVQEARIMNIPVIAIVDTNCDPDQIDHVIPGNDDAIRAINLFVSKMVSAIQEGRALVGADKGEQQAEEPAAEVAPVVEEKAEVKVEAKAPEAKPEAEAKPKATKSVKAKAEEEPKVEAEAPKEEKPKAKKTTKAKTEEKAEEKTEEAPKKAAAKKPAAKKTTTTVKADKEEKAEKAEKKPAAKAKAKKADDAEAAEKPAKKTTKTAKAATEKKAEKAEKKPAAKTKAKAKKADDAEADKKEN